MCTTVLQKIKRYAHIGTWTYQQYILVNFFDEFGAVPIYIVEKIIKNEVTGDMGGSLEHYSSCPVFKLKLDISFKPLNNGPDFLNR